MPARLGKIMKSFSKQVYWREVVAVLMMLLAIVFFRNERKELQAIIPRLWAANPLWLFTGILVTVGYFFLNGGMYRKSFASIGLSLHWELAVVLFLKRNFVSVFLPAGGVSSLAYSPSRIRKAGFNLTQVHQASALFGLAGLLTVLIAGLPVLLYAFFTVNQNSAVWLGFSFLLLITIVIVYAARSIRKKRDLFQLIEKKVPSAIPAITKLFSGHIDGRQFSRVILYSLGIELCGILHICIAMFALNLPVSFGAAASAYIVAVVLMIVSPFLRGLGAVELSLVYVLEQFGYHSAQALSIAILYRLFEFWLPLVAGFFTYAWTGRKIALRILPALLAFFLGIVNIISVVTPPLHLRLHLLSEYIPLTAIHASNLLVLFVGLSLLITAAFLFRGLHSAWMIALILSVSSLIGHLIKAFDYEEAIIAAFTAVVLLVTASQYRIRSSNKWMATGIKTAALSFMAVLVFGFISFYFIDVKHFGIDFSWRQSLIHTGKIFLLSADTTLHPITRFGHEFIWLIRCLGFFTWGFLLFTLIKPQVKKYTVSESHRERAKFLLSQFGNSAVDYFKTGKDKLYFFSDIHEAFIAYRISTGFAIVLEEPVCAEENKADVLIEFNTHCRKMGLKPAFYRVDGNSMHWFQQMRKYQLMIGQEAILEVNSFQLEGKDKKSLRNGLNSLQKKGCTVHLKEAPHTDEFLFELKQVSDEWLHHFQKHELVFSQGMFDLQEIKHHDIIFVKDAAGYTKAFLNIIPDYAEDECTYDLIRKTNDAPGAVMDALIVRLIEYAKEKKQLYLNLGLVPITGIGEPANIAERIIKLAAEKIKRFQHYKGLREFKEKYATIWENKYLVYDHEFDLLQLPLALNNVMKP